MLKKIIPLLMLITLTACTEPQSASTCSTGKDGKPMACCNKGECKCCKDMKKDECPMCLKSKKDKHKGM